MDLELSEVANLLRVPSKMIMKWMQEGRLSGYKIEQEYRFCRNEVERVLLELDDMARSSPLHHDDGLMKFDLFRALFHGSFITEVEGTTKEEIITSATVEISHELQIDHQELTGLLLEREAMMPTALGHGIALPHTREFLMDSGVDIVSVVYPKQPIEYGALDRKPVEVLLFLFASSDKKHLHLLAKIAGFCQLEEHRELLKTCRSQKELLQAVREWEQAL